MFCESASLASICRADRKWVPEMKFGFLIEKLDVELDQIRIRTLDDFDQVMEKFYEVGRVSGGFKLPPLDERKTDVHEKSRFQKQTHQVSSPWMKIIETHEIQSSYDDGELERFAILALSFLYGVYLGPEGSLGINRIPYRLGKLTGVQPGSGDMSVGISAFLRYYQESSPEDRIRLKAVLHWFLLGQTYYFEWDRFDAQYKVLDGLSNLLGVSGQHATKPARLVEKAGIRMPSWAEIEIKNTDKGSRKTCELAELRNELVHEARFNGVPIGYSYPKPNFHLEFPSLNVKLIAFLVGLRSPYLNADPENRDQWLWEFERK